MRTLIALLACCLAAGLCLLGGAGCGKKDDGKEGKEPTKEAPKAIAISAHDLAKEFHADKGATNAKYKDKLLEVLGEVESVDQTEHKGAIVVQGYKPVDDVGVIVQCELTPAALSRALAGVSFGQKIRVTGAYEPSETNTVLVLSNADYAEAGPSELVKMTSKELAKKFAAMPDALRMDVEKKDLLVSGKVLELRREGDKYVVRLEGAGPVAVLGQSAREEAWEGLKKGDEAHIRGRFSPFSTEKEIQIEPGFAVPGK